jgi:hypothetical protein
MKKILRGVCMMAVVALAFTSCNKNNEEKGIHFTGTTQDIEYNEDRAYAAPGSDKKTYFEKDDQIMVYNLDAVDATNTNYGIYWTNKEGHQVDWNYSSGTVINHGDAATTTLFAFYPAEIVNNARLWEGDNEAMFEITDHQVYRKKGTKVIIPKGTWAMASKDEVAANINEKNFLFENIMGAMYLEMKSASAKTVTSIVYEDNVFDITGRVHLKIHMVDPVTLTSLFNNYDPSNTEYVNALTTYIGNAGYFVDDAGIALKGKTITLDCGDGVQLKKNKYETFLITLRPLAGLYGFTLTVNFSDGSHAVLATTENNKIKPNNFTHVTVANVDAFIQ